MCVALIGGMGCLEMHYIEEAEKAGIELRVVSGAEVKTGSLTRDVAAMVVFTQNVSHKVKKQAMRMAKSSGIPVFMHHSCEVCTLRECLNCLLIISSGNMKQVC